MLGIRDVVLSLCAEQGLRVRPCALPDRRAGPLRPCLLIAPDPLPWALPGPSPRGLLSLSQTKEMKGIVILLILQHKHGRTYGDEIISWQEHR